MKHYNITISGRVQGVFFRKYTVQQADALGINGVVRNLPNGDVYIEAEGEQPLLDQFVNWCRKGSPMANVKDVKVEEAELRNFAHFGIGH